ncbi:glycosyltransferase [Bacillus canaveralius]|uniref:glycosyltransferase n=1 Tax=Bacillus canaveralius TaxID=1403243 RepID=UPI003CCBAC6A
MSLFKFQLLVSPSLYDGFGIPLVEAMKIQSPIVCSDRGSILSRGGCCSAV